MLLTVIHLNVRPSQIALIWEYFGLGPNISFFSIRLVLVLPLIIELKNRQILLYLLSVFAVLFWTSEVVKQNSPPHRWEKARPFGDGKFTRGITSPLKAHLSAGEQGGALREHSTVPICYQTCPTKTFNGMQDEGHHRTQINSWELLPDPRPR